MDVYVELHESMEVIRPHAFAGNTNLVSVVGIGVTIVDDGAFEGCTSLVSVTFGEVILLGRRAFAGCVKLTDPGLVVAGNIHGDAFVGSGLTKLHVKWLFRGDGSDGDSGLFHGCPLQTVTYLSGGQDYACPLFFAKCGSLDTVSIPPDVTDVYVEAGRNLFRLKSRPAERYSVRLVYVETKLRAIAIPSTVSVICSFSESVTVFSDLSRLGAMRLRYWSEATYNQSTEKDTIYIIMLIALRGISGVQSLPNMIWRNILKQGFN